MGTLVCVCLHTGCQEVSLTRSDDKLVISRTETLLLIKANFVLHDTGFLDPRSIAKQLTKYRKGQRKQKNRDESRKEISEERKEKDKEVSHTDRQRVGAHSGLSE